jgi:hypothetical protein
MMEVVGYKTFHQHSTFGVKDVENASPAILREKKEQFHIQNGTW